MRFPDGRRGQRRFPRSGPLAAVHDYCLSQVEEAAGGRPFSLSQGFPGGWLGGWVSAACSASVLHCTAGEWVGLVVTSCLQLALGNAPVLCWAAPRVGLAAAAAICAGALCQTPAPHFNGQRTRAQAAAGACPCKRTGVQVRPPARRFRQKQGDTPTLFFLQFSPPRAAGAPPLADLQQSLEDAKVADAMLVMKWAD